MKKGYSLLIAMSTMLMLSINALLAQGTAGPITITSFADSTSATANNVFPQALLQGNTYNIQGTYENSSDAVWVRISHDVYKMDWTGTHYVNRWFAASDTNGVLDGTINYDFTIAEDAALKTDYPDAFHIVQARVKYDPDVDTYWNIFVTVEEDTTMSDTTTTDTTMTDTTTNDTMTTFLVNPERITGINMYPNPATEGMVMIETPNDLPKDVIITDMRGRILKAGSLPANGPIDVSDLTAGMYLISVREGRHVSTLTLSRQ